MNRKPTTIDIAYAFPEGFSMVKGFLPRFK